MARAVWNDDHLADQDRIAGNARRLIEQLASAAHLRSVPTTAELRRWHEVLYDGCTIPVVGFVGHFRGDPTITELVDYEVGVGATLADGFPDRVGVWAQDVAADVEMLLVRVTAALDVLDNLVPADRRAQTVDELEAVVGLAATVHGEWVRIHPFANGNGRTARLWAAFIALRYGLPPFVRVRPRPGGVPYVAASRKSIGRPPHFEGDHQATVNVFAHMLHQALTE